MLWHTVPYWSAANGLVERQNESTLKRLKISQAENSDGKEDFNKYMLMYNTTPHSTTGKTPTMLLLGRTIRDTLPSIEEILYNNKDEQAIDADKKTEFKRKEREDEKRHAESNDIDIGDTVVMKNMWKQNKLSTHFGQEEYLVTNTDNSEVTVQADGKTYKRNVSHLKKVS